MLNIFLNKILKIYSILTNFIFWLIGTLFCISLSYNISSYQFTQEELNTFLQYNIDAPKLFYILSNLLVAIVSVGFVFLIKRCIKNNFTVHLMFEDIIENEALNKFVSSSILLVGEIMLFIYLLPMLT